MSPIVTCFSCDCGRHRDDALNGPADLLRHFWQACAQRLPLQPIQARKHSMHGAFRPCIDQLTELAANGSADEILSTFAGQCKHTELLARASSSTKTTKASSSRLALSAKRVRVRVHAPHPRCVRHSRAGHLPRQRPPSPKRLPRRLWSSSVRLLQVASTITSESVSFSVALASPSPTSAKSRWPPASRVRRSSCVVAV
jgi:hypothetical protein